jgi:hypothetical protein
VLLIIIVFLTKRNIKGLKMTEANLIKLVNSRKDGKARINQALNETNLLIAKELNYSEDLRKNDYLAGLKENVLKLTRVLEAVE